MQPLNGVQLALDGLGVLCNDAPVSFIVLMSRLRRCYLRVTYWYTVIELTRYNAQVSNAYVGRSSGGERLGFYEMLHADTIKDKEVQLAETVP